MDKAIRYYQELLLMSFSYDRIFEIIEKNEDEYKEVLLQFFREFRVKEEKNKNERQTIDNI